MSETEELVELLRTLCARVGHSPEREDLLKFCEELLHGDRALLFALESQLATPDEVAGAIVDRVYVWLSTEEEASQAEWSDMLGDVRQLVDTWRSNTRSNESS